MEIIKKIKQMIAEGVLRHEDAVKYFPELKESEDERIKKAIKYGLDYVFTNNTTVYETTKEQCLAWLERQGEQKPILDVEIPFGAKDSELEEVSYNIPNGYHAEIEDDKVVIKKGGQKPAEWSEEDAKALNRISAILVDASEVKNWWKQYRLIEREEMERLTVFLKSLKDRYTWKPSDEQIIALRWVLNNVPYNKHKEEISGLIEQIKDFV